MTPPAPVAVDVDAIILSKGAHDPTSTDRCVMEWVSIIAGEEFTDHPACTSPVIGAFLRSWNDALDDDGRQQLKRYIPVIGPDGEVLSAGVMGTAASPDVEDRRAWMAMDWLVRVYTPAWLRTAGLVEQADRLAVLAELAPDTVPTIRPVIDAVREDARAAGAAAWDAAGDAAWAAAWDAAGDAAGAAAGDAAWAAAGDAARAAAGDAAWDAARAAARAAAGDAARDAARAAARAAAGAAARDAARAAARAAAGDAARDALRPTVIELQASVHTLIDRMIAVGAEVPA